MSRNKMTYGLVAIAMILILTISCKKKDQPVTVTDIDGNTYNTISVFNQLWMNENLRTTRYSNGDLIETTTPFSLDISGETSPKYQWSYSKAITELQGTFLAPIISAGAGSLTFSQIVGLGIINSVQKTQLESLVTYLGIVNSDTKSIAAINEECTNILPTINAYGNLYTWYAVTDNRNICPTGWHVPTDAQWGTLETFLGTSENGFPGLPSGRRDEIGSFSELGTEGYWWSTAESSGTEALSRVVSDIGKGAALLSAGKKDGLSVRCLKD